MRRRHGVGDGAPPVPKYRGAAAGARRRWRKVFDLEDFDLGVLSGVKPCVDVSVSAAARRRSQNICARRRGRGGDGERILTWRILTLGFCPV